MVDLARKVRERLRGAKSTADQEDKKDSKSTLQQRKRDLQAYTRQYVGPAGTFVEMEEVYLQRVKRLTGL